jgi:hypothetical protein
MITSQKILSRQAANVSGFGLTYNQGYRVIKAEEESNFILGKESYKLIVPYLTSFKELNSGA